MIGRAGQASEDCSKLGLSCIDFRRSPADQGTKFVHPGYDSLQDEYEERARAKLDQIARAEEIADFQLYIVAESHKDRARMRRVLMQIPHFRRWRILTSSIARARCRQEWTHHRSASDDALVCAMTRTPLANGRE
jgi:hypothetical protein